MHAATTFTHLQDDKALHDAYHVMQELRPHLSSTSAFIIRIRRQQQQGYRLLAAVQDGAIAGLAGYRTQENLMYGAFVYVDDLVVTGRFRSAGVGAKLLDAVREQARELGCSHFVLDTGLHMALAQRFYFRQGLLARGMHFVEPLASREA
jgi:GNAT superfamily N-acetyltransferase